MTTAGGGEPSTDNNTRPTASNGQDKDDSPRNESNTVCRACGLECGSRNAVFQHLRTSACGEACLTPLQLWRQQQRTEKVLLLYGYLATTTTGNHHTPHETKDTTTVVRNGHDAARQLIRAVQRVHLDEEAVAAAASSRDHNDDDEPSNQAATTSLPNFTRSFGHTARSTAILEQDAGSSGVAEVVAVRLPALVNLPPAGNSDNNNNQTTTTTTTASVARAWREKVQQYLPPTVQLLGRKSNLPKGFHAELDTSHLRMEYLLPLEFLFSPESYFLPATSTTKESSPVTLLEQWWAQFPSFDTERQLQQRQLDGGGAPAAGGTATTTTSAANTPQREEVVDDFDTKPSTEQLQYLYGLKKLMQMFTTHIVPIAKGDSQALAEKQRHVAKRQRLRKGKQLQMQQQQQQQSETTAATAEADDSPHTTSVKRRKKENVVAEQETDNQPKSAGASTTMVEDDPTKGETGARSTAEDRKDLDESCSKKELEGVTTADHDASKDTNNTKPAEVAPKQQQQHKNVLKRRRYHNFTPTVLAHEYLAYRRVDRFYHRATIRFDDDTIRNQSSSSSTFMEDPHGRPYFLLSLTGDLFLQGQVCRIIGLWIALVRKVIDVEYVQAAFDENYPSLLPTPPVPVCGLMAAQAHYNKWEGKLKTALSPLQPPAGGRSRFKKGKGTKGGKQQSDNKTESDKDASLSAWDSPEFWQEFLAWKQKARRHAARSWVQGGIIPDSEPPTADGQKAGKGMGRLAMEKEWTETVLMPWAERAQRDLQAYRQWKAQQNKTTSLDIVPLETEKNMMTSVVNGEKGTLESSGSPSRLELVDATVPPVFEKVLRLLREADQSGKWPTTTPKRQLVMVSTPNQDLNGNGKAPKKSKNAHWSHYSKTQLNKLDRSSAYDWAEGQGGASGSFSVGAMPGEQCLSQPKANQAFPELVKAAFELEIALRPDRPPSSTIAINRNAQFRPHTDSGAGSGQSISLIVGLGHYAGGELMVEGDKVDIRYKAVEFNGWKQRHWTLPFVGERYSLVWFTPKGCEGVRGIDLDLSGGSTQPIEEKND